MESEIAEASDPRGDGRYEIEFRFLPASGGRRWAITRGRMLFTGSGLDRKPHRFVGTVLDITERREQVLRMEQQREWLRVTMESIGDAVIATDRDSTVTYMNSVAERMTGWRAQDEPIGRSLNEVFHIINEETHEIQENPVERVLQEGVIVGLANHTVLVSRDGSECPIEDSAAPIRDANGEMLGVVLVFHDATESRRAEDALRRTNRRIARILEGIGEAFCSFDREFNITYMNQRAIDAFRNAKGGEHDFIGCNLWAEFPDLIWTDLYEKYNQAVRDQKPAEFTLSYGPSGTMQRVRAYPSLDGLSVFFHTMEVRDLASPSSTASSTASSTTSSTTSNTASSTMSNTELSAADSE